MSTLPAAPRIIVLPRIDVEALGSYAPDNYWPAVTGFPFGSKDR